LLQILFNRSRPYELCSCLVYTLTGILFSCANNLPPQNFLANLLCDLIHGPKKNNTYTRATIPKLINPSVAIAHVVLMLSNMTIPICANAAAIMKLGIKNAAIALAATFGYVSVI